MFRNVSHRLPQIPRGILVFAIAGGIFFHLLLFLTLKINIPAEPESVKERAFVQFEGLKEDEERPVLREQAILMDSAPLFMPTKWNYANHLKGVASLREAAELYDPFEPVLALPEAQYPRSLFLLETRPVPLEFIPRDPGFTLARFGRESRERLNKPAGQGRIEVRNVASGDTIFSEPIPDILLSDMPENLWDPPRLFLEIQASIPVGPPLLIDGSGFNNWDRTIIEFIRTPAFYAKFSDGYFEIRFFP